MSSPSLDPTVTPALAAPPGLTSNLVNPPSQAYITIVVQIVLLVLATPFVFIRLFTRFYVHHGLWWDDASCVLGWIGLVGVITILFYSLNFGCGIDKWNVSISHAKEFSKLFSDIEIVARIGMVFTKVSILLLFLRLFCPPGTRKDKIFYVTWATIWFNVGYGIALVLVVLLQCAGKGNMPSSQCVNTFLVLITASVTNVLSDIVMLAIPMYAVWDLHMPTKRKLSLSVVFGVGFIAVAASIGRLGWQVAKANDPNDTVILNEVTLLNSAEQTAGIIVSCMPMLPAFFSHFFSARGTDTKTASARYITGWRSNGSQVQRPTRGSTGDPYLLSSVENGYNQLDKIKVTTRISQADTKVTKPGVAVGELTGRAHAYTGSL
ncbi:hypothetical protein MMC30_009006 [Trapelia coarctata]|nr:hypothetical protein [Trapelia coarctata]